jgi:hypothetical protein
MPPRTRVKVFLLGSILAGVPCYSLGSDCFMPPDATVARTYQGAPVEVIVPGFNDSTVTGASLERGSTNVPGILHGGADSASRAYALGGEPAFWTDPMLTADCLATSDGVGSLPVGSENKTDKISGDPPVEAVVTVPEPIDRNRQIYYRNKLEFAFDLGTLPINIPFPFDFMEGDPYREHPIKYTLIPLIASLRWHMSNIGGPWIFRGNWDLTASGSFTWIPSGPETRFISYDMGIRRNFVPHNSNFAPYYDIRVGVGQINAKGPKGVPYAQGEDWPEFTLNMGAGLRYNVSPRYAFTAGLNYMHLSNMDLSEHPPSATDPHWGPINYGINVYGPMLGINVRLGKPHGE